MQKELIYGSVFFLILVSCDIRKARFSDAERKWIEIYDKGDTLLFQSHSNIDTTYITRKEVFFPDYDPLRHEKYLPEFAEVWCSNKNFNQNGEYKLLSMIKRNPNHGAFFDLTFNQSGIIFLNLPMDSLKKVSISSKIKFDVFHPKADPEDPREIIWDIEFGIVGYTTHSNEEWRRINY